jgi:hypothetical protein
MADCHDTAGIRRRSPEGIDMEIRNLLKFAYLMQEYDGEETESIVRVTAHECGLTASDIPCHAPRRVADICRRLIATSRHRGAETNALDARFSTDSHGSYYAKRALAQHFRAAMHDHTRHFDLLVKLVERHYIDEAERIGAWSIPAISNQFSAGQGRVQKAAGAISQHLSQLEIIALDNLRRDLERGSIFNQREAA